MTAGPKPEADRGNGGVHQGGLRARGEGERVAAADPVREPPGDDPPGGIADREDRHGKESLLSQAALRHSGHAADDHQPSAGAGAIDHPHEPESRRAQHLRGRQVVCRERARRVHWARSRPGAGWAPRRRRSPPAAGREVAPGRSARRGTRRRGCRGWPKGRRCREGTSTGARCRPPRARSPRRRCPRSDLSWQGHTSEAPRAWRRHSRTRFPRRPFRRTRRASRHRTWSRRRREILRRRGRRSAWRPSGPRSGPGLAPRRSWCRRTRALPAHRGR